MIRFQIPKIPSYISLVNIQQRVLTAAMKLYVFFVSFLVVFGATQVQPRNLADPADILLGVLGKDLDTNQNLGSTVLCKPCEAFVSSLRWMVKTSLIANANELGIIIDNVCKRFHIEIEDVCDGIAMHFKDEIYAVFKNSSFSSMQICGIIAIPACLSLDDRNLSWNITLPNIPKPPVHPPVPPSPSAPKLRVLHLSDIHVDFHYKAGANANCDHPICCQDAYNASNSKKYRPAGKWGDYGWCDVPPRTVENLFEFLSKQTRFDFIVWTGDQTSHVDWNITRQDQLKTLDYLTDLFLKYFPGIPVFPALGNHEGVPVNGFPPPFTVTGNLSSSWLFEAVVARWSNWLPKDTATTLLRGGFYTVLLKPGFRIISLNMNYCNVENWWLMLNMTDPGSQLQWLIDVLQHAETIGEKVQIIGHIPPGLSGCLKAWSWNYYKIINRYESTVIAQMFGHTHYDSWELFYDETTAFKRAVSIAYLAPSVTTLVGLNPGFRVYEMDGFYPNSSWAILNHDNFIMNLTAANLFGNPVWAKEYSAKEAYSMSALNPSDWDDVYRRMFTDDKLFDSFFGFYYKLNVSGRKCDRKCRLDMLCEIRSGRSHDPHLCDEVFTDQHQLALDADNLRHMYEQFLESSKSRSFC